MSEGNGLPDGWANVRIGDLLRASETGNPSSSGRELFQYVDIQAIDNDSGVIASPKELPCGSAPSRARNVMRAGDVMISLVRPYLRNIALVPDSLDGEWASTAFCVCRPTPGIEPRFLFYYFRQDSFLRAIPTYGNSPPSGHDEDLHNTQIALPPSNEQTRITDRIDELFTDLAAGVAALERVRKKLKRYRSAVLHAAVTGRLTEAWRKEHGPPAESGAQLLERLLVERRWQWEERTLAEYEAKGKQPPKNWRQRYQEPVKPKTDELPELPEGWCWASQDQVGEVQLGRQRSPQHHSGEHMRPYLRVANVFENRISTRDVKSMNFTPREFETYELRHGDLLLNEGQSMELIGRPAMYRDEISGCCFQNTLVRQRVCSGVSPDYALNVLLAQFKTGRYRKIAKITTSIAHLGAERFAGLEFPLPPIAEQQAIVEVVQEKFSQIDAMETEIGRGLARAARLRQAILKFAFAGDLLKQDPQDEPASALLDRIRTEREALAAHSNGRPKRASRKKVAPTKKAAKSAKSKPTKKKARKS